MAPSRVIAPRGRGLLSESGGGAQWAANLAANGLTTLFDELDFSQSVPAWSDNGAGGGAERALAAPKAAWSVVSDPNPATGEGIFATTRAGGPKSASSVWEFRANAGAVGGGVEGAGSSGGYGDLGRAINLSEFGIALGFYLSTGFHVHTISHKLFHFEMAGASQFFLVQLAHNLDFFRASDENAGVAYEPQDGSAVSDGTWHQLEIWLKRGAAGTGRLKVWCDGVLRNSVTNLAIAPTGNFTTISLDTTMGGGGYTLSAPQLMAVDHLSIYTP